MQIARAQGRRSGCIYRGWKFCVDGRVLDTPNVTDAKFKDRVQGRTFPAREADGMQWAYLRPKGHEPVFPRYPFVELDDAHRINARERRGLEKLRQLDIAAKGTR